ncbi:hypothetical protein JCM19240_3988 [Vibrio maritimus]|uniref:Tyr recombinase domain-containing protein n=1 Tax=Vibrio maritimus TaxID=990268 RepID=A0A090U615_9VIBR|nr:hypothetical protein JCM19240_3988 [Vibrio maritimus]
MLRDQLLAEGESRVLATMAVKSVESDSALAEMFDDLGIPGYSDKRAAYYAENQAAARAKAIKDNKTKARTISFAKLPKTRAILIKRVNKALPDDKNTRYLFPARETGANRAQKEHAWKPISRQSSYRKIATIRERLAEWVTKQSNKVRDLFEGIRLGLHSMRKAAVQRIFKAKGIEAASKWIGHGNGKGNLATTTDYLDHSAAADRELDDVNAESLGVAA